MPRGKPFILIVEDTESLAETFAAILNGIGVETAIVGTAAEARTVIRQRVPNAVLLDLQLPDDNGMSILRECTAEGLPCSIVVVTGMGSLNVAIEAMKSGAADFLVKPVAPERLRVTVQNAVERQKLRETVETYRSEFDRPGVGAMVGRSLAMQAVYRIIESAAPSAAPVFVTGESGTGKELCAEAIHTLGRRKGGPFIAINCAAIPKDLIESEVFGHVKGAFTGATANRDGAAVRASGGTLFLDEICEMDIGLQAKFLRFVQTGTVQPVGASAARKVDVRFVCATNRNPLFEVEHGRFREDLYYRLHVIPIALPPLRERDDDVIELANHFLERFAEEEKKSFRGFAAGVQACFRAFDWPGNIRQLQNVVRQIVVLHDGADVTMEMLPPNISGARMPRGVAPPAAQAVAAPGAPPHATHQGIRPLWQVEKEAIEAAIAACGGNIPRAAALLEVSASTLYRKKIGWGG